MPSYTLTYFDCRERGEFVRLLFALTGTPLQEVTVEGTKWFSEEKAKTPFGTLPLLSVDDGRVVIGQHLAIGRFLAVQLGLEPQGGPDQKALAECWAEAANDLYTVWHPAFWAEFVSKDPDVAKEKYQVFLDGAWSTWLGRLEGRLADSAWLGGGTTPCWVDAYVAEWTDRVRRCCPDFAWRDFPKATGHSERFWSLGPVAEFARTRKVRLEGHKLYR